MIIACFIKVCIYNFEFSLPDTYNEFIENALQVQEESITKENQLIGQSTYLLNKSGTKWLNIGLSPAAGFTPIIQIKSSNCCIFFTEEEWSDFTGTEGSPNHQFESSTYKDFSVIRLKSRKQQMVFTTETYRNLFNLRPLIGQKLSLLQSAEFVTFYKCILRACLTLSGDLYENIKNVLSGYSNSLNAFYMLEAINLTYNTVSYDYEIMKLEE